jgi:hypothetical protein
MATYKKRGAKKSVNSPQLSEQEIESTTAEVFETLDARASKTEEFVAKLLALLRLESWVT